MISLNSSRMLYGLGFLLGAASILFFGKELIFDLSPVIKSFILFCFTAIFIVSAEHQKIENEIYLYLFSGVSYISFLSYSFSVFEPSSEAVFLVLAASSAVFLSMGYFKNKGRFKISDGKTKNILWILAMLVLVSLIFDISGSQPEYQLDLEESVEVEEGETVELGVLTVSNEFVFSRNLEIPDYRGCILNSDFRRPIFLSTGSNKIIGGNSELEINLTENIRSGHEDGNLSGEFMVFSSVCPEEGEGIYIWEAGEEDRIQRIGRP